MLSTFPKRSLPQPDLYDVLRAGKSTDRTAIETAGTDHVSDGPHLPADKKSSVHEITPVRLFLAG